MNKNLLTVLGCSSSLTLTLLSNQPAKANRPLDLTFIAPNVTQEEVAEITKLRNNLPDCSCNSLTENIVASDQLGDLAISQWGCDCAGCRNMTMYMVESGQLTVPQS